MNEHETPSGTRIILVASMAGSAMEFYDYYICDTAAGTIFGPLFFPSSSRTAPLVAACISLARAFVTRPIGAVVFGHYGDRIGRKSTPVAALIATTLIALLPPYQAIGSTRPALLCTLRCVQGSGLGAEWRAAALPAVENAPPGWSGRLGIAPQLGAPIGYIFANGIFLLPGLTVSPPHFPAGGWRLPFVAGAPLILVGLYVRLRIAEPAAFLRASRETAPVRVPIANLARHHFYALVMPAATVIAGFAARYIGGRFALGHGTTVLGYSRNAFPFVQLGAVLSFPIGISALGIAALSGLPRETD